MPSTLPLEIFELANGAGSAKSPRCPSISLITSATIFCAAFRWWDGICRTWCTYILCGTNRIRILALQTVCASLISTGSFVLASLTSIAVSGDFFIKPGVAYAIVFHVTSTWWVWIVRACYARTLHSTNHSRIRASFTAITHIIWNIVFFCSRGTLLAGCRILSRIARVT